MEYRHEIINFGENVPVKCFIHQLGTAERHWHNSLELLFVMQGSVHIVVDGEQYVLEQDDVILINSNSPHELRAEHCILAAVQIKLSLFDERLLPKASLYFDCNSKTRPNDPGILQIKRIVAQFVKAYASNDSSKLFRAKSLSYALMAELMMYFRVDRSKSQQNQAQQQNERIARIADYISTHYREDITLQKIAEMEYLSVPYMSKFFQRMMGMGFVSYLNQVRLTQAVSDLLSTDHSIDRIASDSGFPNTQSFVRLFKREYDMLPSQYRREKPVVTEQKKAASNEYIILDTHQYLQYFADYLEQSQQRIFSEIALPDIVTHDSADSSISGTALSHTWRTYTSVGSAKELLQADVQTMLKELQQNIHFTYVKFHGILSDDMHVCTRGADGNLQYSFIYVDKALDFLLSIGLKPLIQLSFMPAAIAQTPEHRIFDSTMINSLPAHMEDWCDLVRAFTAHLLQRFGKETVVQWPFTVWNEPDTPTSMFGFESDDAFYAFYRDTWRTVHSVCAEIRIGSPSTYFGPTETDIWLREFASYCRRNQCEPDFMLFHFYGTINSHSKAEYDEPDHTLGQMQLTTDENLMSKSIDMILSFVRSVYHEDMPIFLTEWNFSPSHRELLGDTIFRSCYLVKNILENYDQLGSMGYWLLTDLFEEHQVPPETFHGGLGLYTYNGIKKPSYYAMWILSKLGDERIGQGDGWFLTRKGDDYQLMLYHYQHYSSLYAACEAFDMTDTERYTPFGPEQRREFEIRIVHMPSGIWRAVEYSISRTSGSAFDKWVEMGAQPLENAEEVTLLKSLSLPMLNKYFLQAGENGLSVNVILEPLEVKLITLTKQ